MGGSNEAHLISKESFGVKASRNGQRLAFFVNGGRIAEVGQCSAWAKSM